MQPKINDPRLVLADVVLWLTEYNDQTGLVMAFSADEDEALEFDNDQERDAAIYLINNNQNNSFIGHVPRPHP